MAGLGSVSRPPPEYTETGEMRRFRTFTGRVGTDGVGHSSHSLTLDDRPDRRPVVARADHAMIRSKSRSRRGAQMSATPDSTLVDPEQLIPDLQRLGRGQERLCASAYRDGFN